MAKLPGNFSLQALPIRSAIAEGRTEDAKTLLVEVLRSGKADAVVQGLAADLIKPSKKPVGRQKTLPPHWLEIGEEFHRLRDEGQLYEVVLDQLSKKFRYSETAIRTRVALYDSALEDTYEDRNQ